MIEKKECYRFLWQRTAQNEARLLRVYGQSAKIVLPDQIAGYPLTQIAPYCFSASDHFSELDNWEETYMEAEAVVDGSSIGQSLHELSGSYIETVVLPDSIREIGNCTFYNCKSLKVLSIGCDIRELGSDVFMNCRNFGTINVRCGIAHKTGVRQILHQLSSNMEVYFYGEAGLEAVLFYPEYYEAYDEIAPAHIFGRKITGEGFRARQSFTDGVVDLQQYDAVFPKACVDEPEKTLSRMALNRLCYPIGLSAESQKRYESYVREHAGSIGKRMIHKREMERLHYLCQNKLFTKVELNECILEATEKEWPEGIAGMMQWKQKYYPDDKNKRYEFDDF